MRARSTPLESGQPPPPSNKFPGVVSFYRRFVKNFSSLMKPMTEVLKGKKFKRIDQAQTTFKSTKEKLTSEHKFLQDL